MNLMKKLFFPKRDYVKIFERFNDEDSLNEFFNEVNKNYGKILRIQDVTYSEQQPHTMERLLDNNSSEFVQSFESMTHNKIIVHYRAPEKIEFKSSAENIFDEEAKIPRRKYEIRKTKEAVKKAIEYYERGKDKNSEISEEEPNENRGNSFTDDLPF